MNQLSPLNIRRVKNLLRAALAVLPNLPDADAARLRAAIESVNGALFSDAARTGFVAPIRPLAVAPVVRTRFPRHYLLCVAGGGQVMVRAHGVRAAHNLAKCKGYIVREIHCLGRVNLGREREWSVTGTPFLIEETQDIQETP